MIQWASPQIMQTQVICYLWLAFSYKNEIIIWLKKCRDKKYYHQELRRKLPLEHKAFNSHYSLWKGDDQAWQEAVNHTIFSSMHKAKADYFLIELRVSMLYVLAVGCFFFVGLETEWSLV